MQDEPEGSADAPISMEPKPGMRQELMIVPGEPCFLKFSLPLPGVMAFRVDLPTQIGSVAVDLSTSSITPQKTLTGEQIASETGRLHVRYTLPAISYRLKIVGTARPGRRAPVRITLVIDEMKYMAPPLSLDAGKTEVILDPDSRTAFRQFVLDRYSLVKFSLSNVPALGRYEREISINVRTASGVSALEVEASDPSEKNKYAGYILKPGQYFVEVDGSYNGWPSPTLQEPVRSARIGLHIDKVVPYELPPSMVALSAWLEQTGLDELIEFNELTDFRNESRNLPGASARQFPLVANVAAARMRQRLCTISPERCEEFSSSEEMEAPSARETGKFAWPAGSIEDDRPALAVTLEVKKSRNILRATERAFFKRHGVTLWDRLLQKISNLEGASARRIVVNAPVACSASLVYMDTDNQARRHGMECMSGSAHAPLAITATVNPATNEKLPAKVRGLGDAVRPFLTKFLDDKNARFDFLTLEPEYVEVIIRGLRGRVINGGRDWEKLQLTLSITGKPQRTLRASLDGQLASGIGNYPGDSQFTRDMDVQFKGNVTEYSKKLVTALRAFLEENP